MSTQIINRIDPNVRQTTNSNVIKNPFKNREYFLKPTKFYELNSLKMKQFKVELF